MQSDIDFPISLTIGTKKTRSITLYPLSIADQQKVIAELAASWDDFIRSSAVALDEDRPLDYITNVSGCVLANIEKLLKYVTNGENVVEITEMLTNQQAHALLDHVYAQNFADLDLKKKTIAKYLSLISVEI